MKNPLPRYIIVIGLTVAYPISIYFLLGDPFKTNVEQSMQLSIKEEQEASQIETGETKTYPENIPTMLRLLSNAEKERAAEFIGYNKIYKDILKGMLAVALIQAGLLISLVVDRRHITNRSKSSVV